MIARNTIGKRGPIVTPGPCVAKGERAQLWPRTPDIENVSYTWRLGVRRVRPWPLGSSWTTIMWSGPKMNLMLSDVVDRENYSMIHALMFAFDDYTSKVHWVVWISHFQQYLFSTITITCMGEFACCIWVCILSIEIQNMHPLHHNFKESCMESHFAITKHGSVECIYHVIIFKSTTK